MEFTFNTEKALANSLNAIKSSKEDLTITDSILSEFKYFNPTLIADEVSNAIRNNTTNSYEDSELQNILSCMMDSNDDSELVEYLSTNTKDLDIPELVDSIKLILDEIKVGYNELVSAL